MSALGFGLFLGSVGAAAVSTVAFSEEHDNIPIKTLILAGGIAGWLLVPAVFEGFFDFLIGLASPPLLLYAIRYRAIQEIREKALEALRQREAEGNARKLRRQAAQGELETWFNGMKDGGAVGLCRAKFMGHKSSQDCAFHLSSDRKTLQITPFECREELTRESVILIPLRDVLSSSVAKPKITRTRTKKVPVSIVENKRKSPVARGLVGGVLLGPAGLVVGAASGLNAKTGTRVEHHDVTESYETDGDPQLILGTANEEFPILKFKFDPVTLAEEWMFKIQAAQRAG